jgi:kinesin family protein 18/19
MIGDSRNPGVVPQTLQYMYDLINTREKDSVEVRVSYVEVYNEVIRDLLTSEDTPLDIREEADRGIVISGVSEITASNQNEIMTLLK